MVVKIDFLLGQFLRACLVSLFVIHNLQAFLVEDFKNKKNIPNNFRTFRDLGASGSAQFSVPGLAYIKNSIPKGYTLTLIDLRQEPHGFLNTLPISWYGHHNAINAKVANRKVEQDQQKRLAYLRMQKMVSLCILCKDQKIKKHGSSPCSCSRVKIVSVQSEAELARKSGVNYKRFYVQEAHGPCDDEVDRFIQFVKNLPQHSWLHMHCRAGRGRTTTFLVMYDILRNCSKIPFDALIKKHKVNGGVNLLAENTNKKRWKVGPLRKRLEFIERFYTYCKEGLSKGQTWTSWSKKNAT